MREQWLPSLIWSLFHAIPNSHSCRRTLEPHFLHDTCAIDHFTHSTPLYHPYNYGLTLFSTYIRLICQQYTRPSQSPGCCESWARCAVGIRIS